MSVRLLPRKEPIVDAEAIVASAEASNDGEAPHANSASTPRAQAHASRGRQRPLPVGDSIRGGTAPKQMCGAGVTLQQ